MECFRDDLIYYFQDEETVYSTDPKWIPKTMHSTKPYIYYVSAYTYVLIIKFNI